MMPDPVLYPFKVRRTEFARVGEISKEWVGGVGGLEGHGKALVEADLLFDVTRVESKSTGKSLPMELNQDFRNAPLRELSCL